MAVVFCCLQRRYLTWQCRSWCPVAPLLQCVIVAAAFMFLLLAEETLDGAMQALTLLPPPPKKCKHTARYCVPAACRGDV